MGASCSCAGLFESGLPLPEPAVSRCEPLASGITSDAWVAVNQCSGSKSKRVTAARWGGRGRVCGGKIIRRAETVRSAFIAQPFVVHARLSFCMQGQEKKKLEKQSSNVGTSEEDFRKEEVPFILFPRFCANEAPDMNYVIIMGDLVSCLKGISSASSDEGMHADAS